MADNYTAGLARAAEINRELAAMGRNCGQKDGGPAALEAAAAAIVAEADAEVTPSSEVCTHCGQAVRQRSVSLPAPSLPDLTQEAVGVDEEKTDPDNA